ncbi:helix-turn-helix domain-containing protein [Fervidobacterium thailandense]|uniref:MarR family transcriptional regulator n=1 Tax=Fervidobacterium thailandense TaxID=1008305 RepID=A0A1E3G1H2_9BACT|nr:helix-turn-helix domain-containing protein [Fervidobacterium thailandense]ODN30096.1 MarR family transcriptional regulator [Fervidobacterium thailandense]
MDKKELVLKVLLESQEPLRPGDIAERAGISKEDVDKILKDLKKEGKIESPKRCYYTVKKNG